MTIIEILKGGNNDIINNIDLLANDYYKKKGVILNKGCRACILEMVLTLKSYYKMTQFKFKKNAATYKNKKGDKTTISNSTMTDENAIEFLKTNPERINLFSEYPLNWMNLLKGEAETDEQKERRLAIEAELRASTEPAPTEPDKEKLRETLMRKTMKELREEYPEIKATSINDFVDKVLAE